MAQFRIAQFSDGDVMAAQWALPRPGQRVGLEQEGENLIVCLSDAEYSPVAYTWPRGKSNQEAGLLAWRHFQRRIAMPAA